MMDFIYIFSCLKFKQPQLSLPHNSFSITAEASNVSCVKNSVFFICDQWVSFRAGFFRSFSVYVDLSGLRNAHSLMKCCLVSGAAEHKLQVEFT